MRWRYIAANSIFIAGTAFNSLITSLIYVFSYVEKHSSCDILIPCSKNNEQFSVLFITQSPMFSCGLFITYYHRSVSAFTSLINIFDSAIFFSTFTPNPSLTESLLLFLLCHTGSHVITVCVCVEKRGGGF